MNASKLIRAASLLLVALMLEAGCQRDQSCKKNTIFVDVSLPDAAAAAKELGVVVQVNGTTLRATVPHREGKSEGGLQIEFAGGYPGGATAVVTISAMVDGIEYAGTSLPTVLGSTCTTLAIAVELRGLDGGTDISSFDQDQQDLSVVEDLSVLDANATDVQPLPDLTDLNLEVPDLAPSIDLTVPVIDFSGVDLVNTPPVLIVDADPVAFGLVGVGADITKFVTFTNTGGITGTLVATFTPTAGAGLTAVLDGCMGRTLAPGESCQVSVRYNPMSVMASSTATLTLSDGAVSISTDVTASAEQRYQVTVTVKNLLGASGVLQFAPPGTVCGTNCREYPEGTSLTIATTPGSGSFRGNWTGDCSGSSSCNLTVTSDKTATMTFRPNKNFVFVSSGTVNVASLGAATPLSSADSFCKDAATSAGLGGTTWTAWLTKSGAGNSMADRITTSGGWIRLDGRPFAVDETGLLAGEIFYPPLLTETGSRYEGKVRTGTYGNGTSASNCSDFIDTTSAGSIGGGRSTAAGDAWTVGRGAGTCDEDFHVYCFEQTNSTVVAAPSLPLSYRLAFTSQTTANGGVGVSVYDNLCNSSATNAGITGRSFLAFLPTSKTTSAISRFNTGVDSPNWYRPDGAQITENPVDLADGKILTSVNVNAQGGYTSGFTTWTGGSSPSLVDPNFLCADNSDVAWKKMSGFGGTGNSGDISAFFADPLNQNDPCLTASNHIYCFEQ